MTKKKNRLVIEGPSVINSFSRCECDYRLLDLGENLFAIEWAPYCEVPYAILYHDGVKAHKNFEELATKKGSYQKLEDDAAPEDILIHCPWRMTDERVRIEQVDDEFWNVICVADGYGNELTIGPYNTIQEAAQNLPNDLDVYGDNPNDAY